MGQMVPAEKYVELDAKIEEIKRQLRQSSGYPFAVEGLSQHLQAAVEGRFSVIGDFDPAAYELVEFVNANEGSVPGDTMLARAKEANVSTGESDADRFLANQEKIPAPWRKYYLVFPEVEVVGVDRRIACLRWIGDRWGLDRGLVASGWLQVDRLVRRRA